MKTGTRVIWLWKHPKHRFAMMDKHGEYIGLIKHTYKHRGPQLAAVVFDGNKRMSKVPFDELSVETLT